MTTIGAIRLAAFSGASTSPASVRDCMNYWHSFPAYTTLVPRYLTLTGDQVSGRSDTQAIADSQIQIAAANGIDYFAFDFLESQMDFFAPGVGFQPLPLRFWDEFNNELVLHRSSAYKSLMKYCVILASWGPCLPVLGDDSSFDTYVAPYLVQMFQDPDHMTVLGGRPLLYFFYPSFPQSSGIYTGLVFSNDAACLTAMNALRARCAAASVGNPYIVALGFDTTPFDLAAKGMDAGGLYGVGATSVGQSVASFNARAQTLRLSLNTNYGNAQVPCISTGYDHERFTEDHGNGIAHDRAGNYTCWTPGNPQTTSLYGFPPYNRSLPQTAAQLTTELQAGIAHAAAHSEADTLLICAWQEADATPPLQPTWGGPDYLQSIAKSLGKQRDNGAILRSRGYPFLSR